MSRPLVDVQDQILDRIHAGESVDREGVLGEHPEHREALCAFFEVIDLVEGTGEEGGLAAARLGEFRIIRELGRGGMGRVYEAEQTSLKRRVALKVLPPTLRLDGRLVSRFRREAEAAGRLRHPGIVPVFSVGEAAGTPFFAMELVEGVSLQQVLEMRRAGDDAGLPTEPEAWRRWAVETVARVADALAYAHEQGILHRDVKPANILLGEGGAPRLTDFGLALDLRAPELTLAGEVFGSPQYMSPEQAIHRDTPIDERTDVYSLAVTLYELLTLRLPYDGTTSAELLTALVGGRVVPPRKVDPSIPRALEHVLLGALSKDPRNRYRGADAFALDLRRTLAGQAPGHAPRAPLGRRLRVPLAAAAALALVALGIAVRPDGGDAGGDRAGGGQETAFEEVTDEAATPDPAAVEAAVTQAMAELTVLGPDATAADYEVAIARLRGIDHLVAREALGLIYQAFIQGPGRDDPEARAFLGYREFAHEVPESISFRGYPYLRAVERAFEKRWFGPDEAVGYRLAQEAWEETTRHAQLLLSDRLFRAEDRVRARIGMDPRLQQYRVTTRWAGPFLLCHLGSDSASPFDVVAVSGDDEVEAHLARVALRREVIDRRLARTAAQLTALSEEFTRRYGEALGLKPLTDPWGGRPDLPRGTRSFEDGAPLVVLVAESRDAWFENTPNLVGGPLPPGMGALFLPMQGDLYTFVDEPDEPDELDAELERAKLLHEAIHQLQFWYRRQGDEWRSHAVGQNWLDEGVAEYLSEASPGSDGVWEFTGLSRLRLWTMQGAKKQLERRGQEYPFFPIGRLVSFRTYQEAQTWGNAEFGVPHGVALGFFYAQAWALTYFLNEAEDGRYREGFLRYLDAAFGTDWLEGGREKAFRTALGIESDAQFDALEAAYQAYVKDHLMKLEVGK